MTKPNNTPHTDSDGTEFTLDTETSRHGSGLWTVFANEGYMVAWGFDTSEAAEAWCDEKFGKPYEGDVPSEEDLHRAVLRLDNKREADRLAAAIRASDCDWTNDYSVATGLLPHMTEEQFNTARAAELLDLTERGVINFHHNFGTVRDGR